MRKGLKKLGFIVLIGIISLVLVIWGVHSYTSKSTSPLNTYVLGELPNTKVALVLGTSEYLVGGGKNLYFTYRIEAAYQLYEAGKCTYFLVSGDNSNKNYNEPKRMRDALIEKGIPNEHIILDYAGFRTLDSVVRAKKVFGQDSILVVSQRFHNERAIYLAKHNKLYAFGYNAKDVKDYAGFKTHVREYLARVKMMLDLYILQTEPKFLGEKVEVG